MSLVIWAAIGWFAGHVLAGPPVRIRTLVGVVVIDTRPSWRFIGAVGGVIGGFLAASFVGGGTPRCATDVSRAGVEPIACLFASAPSPRSVGAAAVAAIVIRGANEILAGTPRGLTSLAGQSAEQVDRPRS